MRVEFRLPEQVDPDICEDYFVGGWFPAPTDFDFCGAVSRAVTLTRGSNFFLLASRSPFGDDTLAWNRPEGWTGTLRALAFRGYVLAPPLTSRSPRRQLFDYWDHGGMREHNGVFTAALVRDEAVTLVQDAFGMSPLYHRACGDGILFATNPRLLSTGRDEGDPIGWRGLLQAGFVPGDRTLTRDVWRCRAGTEYHVGLRGPTTREWFDFGGLSSSCDKISDQALEENEVAFQRAMDRCLALADAGWSLPLSGGDDSRRILAALVHRGVPADSLTVRVYQKGGRDLDAPAATELAARFGFASRVIDLPDTRSWAEADRVRRVLMDGETHRHTWSMFLWRIVNDRPRIFLDGLGGDVLGETGFEDARLHTHPEEQVVALIAHLVIGDGFQSHLSPHAWASLDLVREDLRQFLSRLPRGDNWPDIAFLLLRSRRLVAPWAQSLAGAGHVIAYPYLDLDFVRTAMRIDPLQRITSSLQALCLEKYWPEYFAFHGSRRISPKAAVNSAYRDAARLACLRQMSAEISSGRSWGRLRSCLSTRGRLVATAARWSDAVASRQSRWLFPVLALGSRESRARVFSWDC